MANMLAPYRAVTPLPGPNGSGDLLDQYHALMQARQPIPAGMKYQALAQRAAGYGVNPGGQLTQPAPQQANTQFSMAPRYQPGAMPQAPVATPVTTGGGARMLPPTNPFAYGISPMGLAGMMGAGRQNPYAGAAAQFNAMVDASRARNYGGEQNMMAGAVAPNPAVRNYQPQPYPQMTGQALQTNRRFQVANSGGTLRMTPTVADVEAMAASPANVTYMGRAPQVNMPNTMNTPGGALAGNYAFSPGDSGINATALVKQNPNALFGFTPQHRQAILNNLGPSDNPLAKMQQDYKARQLVNQQDLAMRKANVLAQAMERGQARQDRLLARKAPPNFMDSLMQQNPELAMEMARLNNHNMLAQAQLGLAQQQAQNEFTLGQDKNKILGMQAQNEYNRWNADQQTQMAAVHQTVASQLRDENPGMSHDEALAKARQMFPAAGGASAPAPNQDNSLARSQPPVAPRRGTRQQEEMLASIASPEAKRDYMKNVLRWSDSEITKRLSEGFRNDNASDYFWGLLGRKRNAPNVNQPEGSWDFSGSPFTPNLYAHANNLANGLYEIGSQAGVPWGWLMGSPEAVKAKAQERQKR